MVNICMSFAPSCALEGLYKPCRLAASVQHSVEACLMERFHASPSFERAMTLGQVVTVIEGAVGKEAASPAVVACVSRECDVATPGWVEEERVDWKRWRVMAAHFTLVTPRTLGVTGVYADFHGRLIGKAGSLQRSRKFGPVVVQGHKELLPVVKRAFEAWRTVNVSASPLVSGRPIRAADFASASIRNATDAVRAFAAASADACDSMSMPLVQTGRTLPPGGLDAFHAAIQALEPDRTEPNLVWFREFMRQYAWMFVCAWALAGDSCVINRWEDCPVETHDGGAV